MHFLALRGSARHAHSLSSLDQGVPGVYGSIVEASAIPCKKAKGNLDSACGSVQMHRQCVDALAMRHRNTRKQQAAQWLSLYM